MKKSLFYFAFIISVSIAFSQEKPTSAKENSINNQFNELLESSNNYKDYKVVKKAELSQLQQRTNERIQELNEQLNKANTQISNQQQELDNLKKNLSSTNANLDQVTQEKNQISFFGIQMDKGSYQTLMWIIIFALLLVLAFFIYKYKNSHILTKEARENQKQTEEEFDNFRKSSLEKQQKLGRMLQDERNKLSKNKDK